MKINSNISVKVVQVYAPTSDHEDKVVGILYEEITQRLRENKTKHTVPWSSADLAPR